MRLLVIVALLCRLSSSSYVQHDPFPVCTYRPLVFVTPDLLLTIVDAVRFQLPPPVCPVETHSNRITSFSDEDSSLEALGGLELVIGVAQSTRRVFVLLYVPFCPISQQVCVIRCYACCFRSLRATTLCPFPQLLSMLEACATMYPEEAFAVIDVSAETVHDLPTGRRALEWPMVVEYTVPFTRRRSDVRRAWLVSGREFRIGVFDSVRGGRSVYSHLVHFIANTSGRALPGDDFSPLDGKGPHKRFLTPRPVAPAFTAPEPVGYTLFCCVVTVGLLLLKLWPTAQPAV